MFLAIGRPRPVPPRLVVKYGSKTCAQIGRRRCRRRGRRRRSRTRPPGAAVVQRDERRASEPARRRGAVDRVPRVDEHVDERDAQPLGVGRHRRRAPASRSRRDRARPGRTRCAAAADSRQSAFRSAGASSKRIGRAKSSTSLTMRLSRATSSSMSATASRSAAGVDVRLPQRVQRRLDDHQRVADLVRDDGREAAERRQPLLLRHLALEARDRVGQRVERRRQQPRVLVVPAAGRRASAIFRVRSPVAATSRMTSVMAASGRVIVRATREAQERREQRPRRPP